VDSNDVERHTHKATTPTKKGRKSPIKAWNELVTKAEKRTPSPRGRLEPANNSTNLALEDTDVRFGP